MSEGSKCAKSLATLVTSAVALQFINPDLTHQVMRDLSLYEGLANYGSYYLGEGMQWIGTVAASLTVIGSGLSLVYNGTKDIFNYIGQAVNSKLNNET
ncbi:MAG: hypothetical protein DRP09_21985 [Candidatus Thorarchaeota archaeon]|nr:MAG: hypothetical protein DRP09_21985 [Candidatus Thorarchaeota archaeon]